MVNKATYIWLIKSNEVKTNELTSVKKHLSIIIKDSVTADSY